MTNNQDSGPAGDADDLGSGRAAASLVGLALLGARTLASRSRELVTDLARNSARRVEAHALGTLKRKLDRVSDGEMQAAAGATSSARGGGSAASTAPSRATDPALLLSRLLQASMDQSQEDARRQLHYSLLRQLVPDEARVLAALADGSVQAMCHVGAGPMVGAATHRVLENFSGIGRAAALRCADAAPHYVRHLRDLGLVESGPEEPRFGTQYQLLESDSVLRRSLEQIEKQLKLKPRIYRHTIRMSELGKQLWTACQPGKP